MSYATLMVYVDVEGKPDGRVSVAADLARRFDAHLIGIASGASISVALGEDAPNEAVAETPQLRDMKALLDQKGQEFRAAIGTSGRRVEWRSVVGPQADAVAREARPATCWRKARSVACSRIDDGEGSENDFAMQATEPRISRQRPGWTDVPISPMHGGPIYDARRRDCDARRYATRSGIVVRET
jgi:hypothetical protein